MRINLLAIYLSLKSLKIYDDLFSNVPKVYF